MPHKVKFNQTLLLSAGLLWAGTFALAAATIYQSGSAAYIAFEGESVASILAGSPTSWIVTNDVSANGGKAIYQAGANQTASSSSFATYTLVFTQPGTYSVYYRWRADKAYTDVDPNSANSFRLPVGWGDLENDSTSTNFVTASVNNAVAVPAANAYNVFKDSTTYTVDAADAGNGKRLTFKIGTREAGMFIDRFILSTNDALTEADFNALANSDTEVVVQGPTDTFIAFQAERVGRIIAGTPTSWVVTNDASANGGLALYQAGANQTASASSFAYYSLKFGLAGTYSLYYRWRADKAYTDVDPNSANSLRLPVDWGDLENDSTSTNFATASVNNAVAVPAANSYNVFKDSQTYTVTQAQIDSGTPLIFKIGTREAGMLLDRFVFSTSDTLTEAEISGLPDSGSKTPPKALTAAGTATLDRVTVSFDSPLAAASANPSNFQIPGLQISSATLDPATSRDILLLTSPQTPGSNYTITINGVTSVAGAPIVPNAKVSFSAWRLSAGWVTREIYFNVDTNAAGGGIADLLADAKYPDKPNIVTVIKGFQINNDISGNNYGARLRAFFTPPSAGVYEFYLYNDDAAQVSLSTDEGAANLALLIDSPTIQGSFDPGVMGTSPSLVAGRRYLLEVLYRQNTSTALLGVAVRKQGDATPPASLPILGGDSISTYINPDAGIVNFHQQPASVNVPAGGRAKFSVSAASPSGEKLYYQWQAAGANIPGATRPNYTTPILSAADNGKVYRCVVGVSGVEVPSQGATVTIGPAQPSPLQPYVGINFVGGEGLGTTIGAALAVNDVAGAVLQENFNNVAGTAIDGTQSLVDAQGAATPVTVAVWDPATGTTVAANAALGIGTGNDSADHAMMQGCIANNDLPLSILIGGVPSGTYNLLVYSVGFNYNSTYEQDEALVGAIAYPTVTVHAQDAREFIDNPSLVRMSSTNAAARDLGNYVMFENVAPAIDGTLLLTVTPQSTNVGNTGYFPPINALQLVKVVPVTVPPSLTSSLNRAAATLTIDWTDAAKGYVLETSSKLGAGAAWAPAAGAPNPIAGPGSVSVNVSTGAGGFYRLRK